MGGTKAVQLSNGSAMPARLEGSEGSQECTGHLSGGASTRMEGVREEEDGGRERSRLFNW